MSFIGKQPANVIVSGQQLVDGTITPSKLAQTGFYSGIVVPSALNIDCAAGNFFAKSISADSTFTFSNVPPGAAYAFVLELTHSAGIVTWPTSVRWPSSLAPSLTTGKVHVFTFVTDNGGVTWRGAALLNYDT